MDHSGVQKQWDPYQTSHRRDFVYRPNSSEPVYGTSTAKVHRNPYTLDEPADTKTVYNEEFNWKPTSKPACIRTGTASGNRRNNPHPSESFMVWRMPRGPRQMSAYDGKPGTSLPLEQQITDALSAQYRSTYRTDYLGIPQGVQKPTKLKPLSSEKTASYTIDTEMRHNYCRPQNKPDLQGNTTRYGCNALHGVAPKGIVPAVVHSHIRNQETRKQLTSYDMHFGAKATDISDVLRSLQPQELKQLYQHLPQKDKDAVDAFLLMTSRRSQVKKGSSSPRSPCKPDWMSTWAGPL